MSLAGRTAFVTGASRGIGRGIAVELAIAGARVIVRPAAELQLRFPLRLAPPDVRSASAPPALTRSPCASDRPPDAAKAPRRRPPPRWRTTCPSSQAGLDEVAAAIAAGAQHGGSCVAMVCDHADDDAVESVIDAIFEAHGDYILVINAFQGADDSTTGQFWSSTSAPPRAPGVREP